jgi:hypothetical protein
MRRHPLAEHLSSLKSSSADELLEHFIDYVSEIGLELYSAQEEAILEIFAGKNVILSTPTGSGKSLVATAMIFRTLANAGRAFYTCPVKALVNEKFFQLTDAFGPKNVGMMTGDATINPRRRSSAAPPRSARAWPARGRRRPDRHVVMDEFHYYSDRERGDGVAGAAAQPRANPLPADERDARRHALLREAAREAHGRVRRALESRAPGAPRLHLQRGPPLHEAREAHRRDGPRPIYPCASPSAPAPRRRRT